MRVLPLMLAAAAAIGATLPGGAGAATPAKARRPAPHAARDWSQTVTLTPGGAYAMGNPNAKVTVVEFASYTCPHCAHFAAEVIPQMIAEYVKTGLIRYEFHNAVHDGFDMTAAVIARCAGPRGFFPMTDAFFAAQPQWTQRGAEYVQKQGEAWEATATGDRPRLVAEGSGLSALAAGHGVPIARQRACLADTEGMKPVIAMVRDAADRNIPYTPAFLINGALADGIRDWPTLKARISQSLGK